MRVIDFEQFAEVEMRVGRVVRVQPFPEAHKPAWILEADFGDEIGVLKSSAQITDLYAPEDLIGRLIVGVINLGEKQIGPIRSQFLVSGFADSQGRIVLCVPDREVPVGARLH